MATTLTFGRKRPVTGDLGSVWFPALEDNITLDDAHDHDGTDSAQLTNAAIATAAAIARSKLASGTASHVLINDGSGVMSSEATLAKSRGGAAADMSSVTFPSSGTIATLAGTQAFTNKDYDGGTAANTSRITFPSGTLAAITALTRKEGTVWYATDTDKLYKDDGTSLTEIGSGSGGSINYILNPDAETATTGWATYADAAGTSPVDGTGGSPTVTITRTTTTPLRGTGSFLITKDAANRQGDGVSYAFSIDSADKAKVLNVSFDYEIASGTFASGDSSDLRVWIYDVTNTVLIPVSPYTIQGGSGQHKFSGVFQTSSNSTSYRLIVHVATTSASAWTFEFDNVVVGPQIQLYGAPIGDWNSNLTFTPASAAFGTISSSSFVSRIVGDTLEVRGSWVCGVTAGGDAKIALPSGYTIDTAKLNTTLRGLVGSANRMDDSTTAAIDTLHVANPVFVSNSDTSSVYIAYRFASSNYLVEFGNSFANNSDTISVQFSVPILGKSSTVLMSNDTDTRVVAMRASGNPASAAGGAPIIYPTSDFDTHSAYNASTGRYTAPVSGYYQIQTVIGNSGTGRTVSIYVDAVMVIAIGLATSGDNAFMGGVVRVNAGQVIDIRPDNTLDADATGTLSIYRLSGPSAIAATETIAAVYTGNAAQSITTGSTDIIDFEDISFDTHGSVTVGAAWKFTAQAAGKYRVSSLVGLGSGNWASGEAAALLLYKNGSLFLDLDDYEPDATHSNVIYLRGSSLVSLIPGDYVDVRVSQNSGITQSVVTNAGKKSISIERIGN